MEDITLKTCTKCMQAKPSADYYRNARRRDGLMARCKACDEDRRRRYRAIIQETGPAHPKQCKPGARQCAIEDCDRRHYARNWCAKHYQRWRATGDPLEPLRIIADNSGQCAVDDCPHHAVARGWCNTHYQRWYTHGDAATEVRQLVPNGGQCTVEDCPTEPRSRTSLWCETHYQRWYRTGDLGSALTARKRFAACQSCGEASSQRKFCSPKCTARFYRDTPLTAACQICSGTFPTKNTRSTCSTACARELTRRKNARYHQNAMATNAAYRDGLRRSTLRRRARMAEAFVEDFSPIEIHERDNWICGICRNVIDPTVAWPGRWSATIDHIVPIARGGRHERTNVQSAHLTCNCSKRDRGHSTPHSTVMATRP